MKIYINREGGNSGPYSTEEVQGLIRKGEVHESDMAWMEGMLGWTTVKAIVPDKPSAPLPNIPSKKPDRTSALIAVCAVLFLMIGAGVFVILTDPFEWLEEKKIPIASANSPAEKNSSSNGKGDNTPTAEATPPPRRSDLSPYREKVLIFSPKTCSTRPSPAAIGFRGFVHERRDPILF